MRRLVLATAVVAFTAGSAMAQGRGLFGFGQGPLYLLSQKSVQEELKLTNEQMDNVSKAIAKLRESMQDLRVLAQEERRKKLQEFNEESEKRATEILKPKQATRLGQINLQLEGGRSLAASGVAKELKLTDEQNRKIKNMQNENQEKIREIFQKRVGDGEEAVKKMQELNKEVGGKMLELLTDEQKAKWKEMLGKPFTGNIEFGPRRRQ